MCSARILSRLRSKHAAKTQKTRQKPKMPLLLVEAVSQCKCEKSATLPGNVPEIKTPLDIKQVCQTVLIFFESSRI